MNTTRAHHRTTSSISRPIPHAHGLVSPPTSPSNSAAAKTKTRRPSVSSPMTWLTRASSSASTSAVPYAPSRPVRISEPRFANPVDALAHARVPVLLLQGEGDRVVPPHMARELAAAGTGHELHAFSGAGHCCSVFADPGRYWGAVLGFLGCRA